MKVLLVAERFNLGGERWPWAEEKLRTSPSAWLEYSRDLGCFGTPGTMNGDWWERRGRACPGREKLLSIGARWDDALNLLPPAKSGAWEPDWARWSAAELLKLWNGAWELPDDEAAETTWRYDKVLLVGFRVARAFDCPLDFCEIADSVNSCHGWENVLCLPHPSGRSRWWNEADLAVTRGIVGAFLNQQEITA